MSREAIHDLIDLINSIALGLIIFLLGGLIAVLGRRLYLYRKAGWPIPALLRRNLIFFGGLGGLVAESIILRSVAGDLFTGDTLLRLAFILHYDIIVILLFSYYLKTEAVDIEDPQTTPGPQGERGERGEQGIQGEKGEKGDPS